MGLSTPRNLRSTYGNVCDSAGVPTVETAARSGHSIEVHRLYYQRPSVDAIDRFQLATSEAPTRAAAPLRLVEADGSQRLHRQPDTTHREDHTTGYGDEGPARSAARPTSPRENPLESRPQPFPVDEPRFGLSDAPCGDPLVMWSVSEVSAVPSGRIRSTGLTSHFAFMIGQQMREFRWLGEQPVGWAIVRLQPKTHYLEAAPVQIVTDPAGLVEVNDAYLKQLQCAA